MVTLFSMCARMRRLEDEASDAARHVCIESGRRLGLHLSCEDEFECSDKLGCDFFKEALAEAIAFDEALP